MPLTKPYSFGAYNKCNETEQWIRITEGCPNRCPFCYEPQEFKVFGIPEIVKNDVKIMDMNLLAKPEALDIINELGSKKVNDKVVYYELICGVDYRFLTQELAGALKKARFRNIRIAWDFQLTEQYRISNAIKRLIKAGYQSREIMVFMICNWLIKPEINMKKMDLCKVWNVKVADCYYDNQLSPNITPIHWSEKEIKEFRKNARKHNQLVMFRIDPEIKTTKDETK
jgi:hypothetical protein